MTESELMEIEDRVMHSSKDDGAWWQTEGMNIFRPADARALIAEVRRLRALVPKNALVGDAWLGYWDAEKQTFIPWR